MRSSLLAAFLAALWATAPSRADACGGGDPIWGAIPATGAAGIPPGSSIIAWGWTGPPTGLALTAGGSNIELEPPTSLGPVFPNTVAAAWIVGHASLASTEYVLTVPNQVDGGRVELTRFVTTALYDMRPATGGALTRFTPWIAHYPLDQLGKGNCIASDAESYVDFGFDPIQIPDRGPESTFYTLSIAEKSGGSAQTASFVGSMPLPAHPTSVLGWSLDAIYFHFEPAHEYCATLIAHDGDLVVVPVASATLCSTVIDIAAPGASGAPAEDSSAGVAGTVDASPGPDVAVTTVSSAPESNKLADAGPTSGCTVQPESRLPPGGALWSLLAVLAAVRAYGRLVKNSLTASSTRVSEFQGSTRGG